MTPRSMHTVSAMEPDSGRTRRRRGAAVAAAAVALALAGCASQSGSPSSSTSPRPAPAATSAATSGAPSTSPPLSGSAATSESATTGDGDGANPLGGNSPEDELMPDVVCMDLQDAQDEIQDHGVFFSRSEDASGDGRRQIVDRNWVVVAQYPAPGSPIGEAEAVLSVLKHDETAAC